MNTILQDILELKQKYRFVQATELSINKEQVKCCYPYGYGDVDVCFGISVVYGNDKEKYEDVFVSQLNGTVTREGDSPDKTYDVILFMQDWIKIIEQVNDKAR